METRLQKFYSDYLEAKQDRLSLFQSYRTRGLVAPLQDRCDALYRLNMSRLAYAKQYHGKHFSLLYDSIAITNRALYETGMLYEKQQSQEMLTKCVDLGNKVRLLKKELYGITFDGTE
jgi:hypothetical protein